MMLARGAARRKEIAIRLALGGGRRDIVQQLLAESLMLALMGGVAGLFIAWWSTGVMVSSMSRLAPIDLVYSATPDLRVLAATFGFCLFSTVLFGFMPAWNLSRPDLVTDLKDGELRGSGQTRLFSRGNILVMGQICLSLTLLTAAGLFSAARCAPPTCLPASASPTPLWWNSTPALPATIGPGAATPIAALLARLRALPGVESASLAATVPFGMTSNGAAYGGQVAIRPTRETWCTANPTSSKRTYFQTMGIGAARANLPHGGRRRTRSAVVLDRMAADRLWPNGDALGKHILLSEEEAGKAREMEVVGIVANVQEHVVGRGEQPHVYFPFGEEYQSDMHIHLKVVPSRACCEPYAARSALSMRCFRCSRSRRCGNTWRAAPICGSCAPAPPFSVFLAGWPCCWR